MKYNVIIKITDKQGVYHDPLNRTHIGYERGMSQDDIYQASRGCWRLSAGNILNSKPVSIFIVYKNRILLHVIATGIQRVKNNGIIGENKSYFTGDIQYESPYLNRYFKTNKSYNCIEYVDDKTLESRLGGVLVGY